MYFHEAIFLHNMRNGSNMREKKNAKEAGKQ